MKKQELISPEGLRQDGRRPNELRAFTGEMGILEKGEVDGFSFFELGNTRVTASVVGPREALERTAIAADVENGQLTVRIHAAAFSSAGGERRIRNDRRLQEWSKLAEGAFSSSVMSEAFPRSVVDVFVEILNADGSVLAAIINAINLALIDAGIPMKDYIAAVSVVVAQQIPLLDPNRMEESGHQPALTIAILPRSNKIVLTSAEPRLPSDKVGQLFNLASNGAKKLFETIDSEVVRKRLAALHNQRIALQGLENKPK